METVIYKLYGGGLAAAIALAVCIAVGSLHVWQAHGSGIAAARGMLAPALQQTNVNGNLNSRPIADVLIHAGDHQNRQ
jgi:hypothetical protein